MADDAVTPETLVAQYNAYVADLGTVGSRYSTSQTFYMSVVTGLVAVVTFAKDSPFSGHVNLITASVLFFLGLICFAWWKTLSFYHDHFAAKLAVLKKMEGQGTLFPIFHEEWDILQAKKTNQLIATERLVPLIVGIAALIGGIAVIYYGLKI